MKDSCNHQRYPIPFRKVNVLRQTNYVYHTATGDITITPLSDGRVCVRDGSRDDGVHAFTLEGEGVTIEFLRDLHRMDNCEAEQNLRQASKPATEREKQDIKAWRADPDHPEREQGLLYPEGYQRWNISIDSLWEEENGTNALDRDPVMLQAWADAHPETTTDRDSVREYVDTLSERQRQLYQLHFIEGRTLDASARMMGVSHQRASAILKQIERNLNMHFRQ